MTTAQGGDEIEVRYTDGSVGYFRMPTQEEIDAQDAFIDGVLAEFRGILDIPEATDE